MTFAKENLFAQAIDLKLEIDYQELEHVGILHFGGFMNYPDGIKSFKTCILLGMAETNKFILNLEKLTYLDSLSLSEMVNLYKILKTSNGELRICNANELVKELFSTANADKIIPLFPSLEQAFRSLSA